MTSFRALAEMQGLYFFYHTQVTKKHVTFLFEKFPG